MIERLIDNFDLLATAPNGVSELRKMILQLAVQGKLVPQDTNDEPASTLLDKIKEEKKRLFKEGKIKKQELPAIAQDELPYELPDGWCWSRLREVAYDLGQKVPDSEFTYIDVSSINKEIGIISTDLQILKPEDAPSRARKIVELGTVIYSTVRPYLLNIAVIDKEFQPEPIVSTAFFVLHPFIGILNRYIYYYLRSKPFIDYVNEAMTGMAYPAVNDGKMSVGYIPIPPAKEQKRIVAKVDQLMALCDDLESKQQEYNEKRLSVNSSCLHSLTTASKKTQPAAAQRLFNNFDKLYTHPQTVSGLRKTILQLAVQGKLVPQNPNDEPAEILLEKIKEEKEKLIKEGKIKKQKPLSVIDEEEFLFNIPDNWQWSRLQDYYDVRDGTHDTPKYVSEGIPLITSKDFKNDDIDFSKAKLISEHDHNIIKKRSFVEKNDILFSMIGGNIGNMVMVNTTKEFSIKNVALFKYYDKDFSNPKYLMYYLKYLSNQIQSKALGGAQPFVSLTYLRNHLFPLPPIEEQKRIVSKVDHLMSLCDELESKLTHAESNICSLTQSVVASISKE